MYNNRPAPTAFTPLLIVRKKNAHLESRIFFLVHVITSAEDFFGPMDSTVDTVQIQIKATNELRLFHDFLHCTLIVITMIYKRRYGWHKDVFILFKRFDDQRLRQRNSILWNLDSSWPLQGTSSAEKHHLLPCRGKLLSRFHKIEFHWRRRWSSKLLKRIKTSLCHP